MFRGEKGDSPSRTGCNASSRSTYLVFGGLYCRYGAHVDQFSFTFLGHELGASFYVLFYLLNKNGRIRGRLMTEQAGWKDYRFVVDSEPSAWEVIVPVPCPNSLLMRDR